MLRHQLACVNIPFSIHNSSHSIKAITYPPHIIHAPHVKQPHTSNFTWTILVQQAIQTVSNKPNQYVGCPWTAHSSVHQCHFFGTETHGPSRLHNTQTIFMASWTRNNQIGEDPYLSKFLKLHNTGTHA